MTANSWTRDNSSNNFLYNQGSELNSTTGMYDLPYRNYDAALGRFFQVDPLAARDHDRTPYHYAGNNPIGANDPTGLTAQYYANPQDDPMWQYVWSRRGVGSAEGSIAAFDRGMAIIGQWTYDLQSWVPNTGGGGGGYTLTGEAAQRFIGTLQRGGSVEIFDDGKGGVASGAYLTDSWNTSGVWTNSTGFVSARDIVTDYGMAVYNAYKAIQTIYTASTQDEIYEKSGTPWMDWMKSLYGTKECGNLGLRDHGYAKQEADNSLILSMLVLVNHSTGRDSHSTLNEWCAGAANFVLGLSGIKGTGSAAAGSFMGYGREICELEYGAIGLIWDDKRYQVSHVGFYAGTYSNGDIKMLGGNQSGQINYIPVNPNSIIYWCMPPGY